MEVLGVPPLQQLLLVGALSGVRVTTPILPYATPMPPSQGAVRATLRLSDE